MQIKRQMCAVKSDIIFKGEFQLPSQAPRDRTQTRPKQSVMHDEKIDTFITGEAPHWAAVAAEELGINLFLGGHYATETFGVRAVAAHLSQRFKLPWEFLNFPTGL